MSDTKTIAIAVVRREDEVLVGQRPPGVPLAGLWEFPGGKVEAGESIEAAAVRECLEETGIAVEITGSLHVQLFQYEHGRVQLHFLECRPVTAATNPLEPFRWVKLDQLRELDFPDGNREVIDRLVGGERR